MTEEKISDDININDLNGRTEAGPENSPEPGTPPGSYEYLLSALAARSGENIVSINLESLATLADVFILVTGNSEVHMRTLTEAAEEALERHGHACRIEGEGSSNWRLVDAGHILVHVFSRKGREFYRLERLWENGRITPYEPVSPEGQKQE